MVYNYPRDALHDNLLLVIHVIVLLKIYRPRDGMNNVRLHAILEPANSRTRARENYQRHNRTSFLIRLNMAAFSYC